MLSNLPRLMGWHNIPIPPMDNRLFDGSLVGGDDGQTSCRGFHHHPGVPFRLAGWEEEDVGAGQHAEFAFTLAGWMEDDRELVLGDTGLALRLERRIVPSSHYLQLVFACMALIQDYQGVYHILETLGRKQIRQINQPDFAMVATGCFDLIVGSIGNNIDLIPPEVVGKEMY